MCDLLADRPRDCHLVRREPDASRSEKFRILRSAPPVEISILAILCALVSILFCVMLHGSDHLYKKFFKNPYLRVFAGGCIVVVLTLLVGDQTYNGTGINIIARCMDGTVPPRRRSS